MASAIPIPFRGSRGARGADRDEGVHPIPSDRHPTHPIFVNCPFGSNPLAVTPAHAQGGITPSLSPVETDMTLPVALPISCRCSPISFTRSLSYHSSMQRTIACSRLRK